MGGLNLFGLLHSLLNGVALYEWALDYRLLIVIIAVLAHFELMVTFVESSKSEFWSFVCCKAAELITLLFLFFLRGLLYLNAKILLIEHEYFKNWNWPATRLQKFLLSTCILVAFIHNILKFELCQLGHGVWLNEHAFLGSNSISNFLIVFLIFHEAEYPAALYFDCKALWNLYLLWKFHKFSLWWCTLANLRI